MPKKDIQHKVSRFYTLMVFLCLFMLFADCSPIALTSAESEYEEEISFTVNTGETIPSQGSVYVTMSLFRVKEQSDYSSVFLNEKFKYVQFSAGFRWYNSSLTASVVFDTSQISSIEEGRMIAERIMGRIENIWGIKFLFNRHLVTTSGSQYEIYNETYYYYEAKEEHSSQKIKDVILHFCPDEGFGKILYSMTYWDSVDIDLQLELDEQCNPVWNMNVFFVFTDYFVADEVYSYSLKNFLGYSESIQSSPESSDSYLFISIDYDDERYELKDTQHVPEQMSTGWEYNSFSRNIKGESVDDLAISFKLALIRRGETIPYLGLIAALLAVFVIGFFLVVRAKVKSRKAYIMM